MIKRTILFIFLIFFLALGTLIIIRKIRIERKSQIEPKMASRIIRLLDSNEFTSQCIQNLLSASDNQKENIIKKIALYSNKFGQIFDPISDPTFPIKLKYDKKSVGTIRSVMLISPAKVRSRVSVPSNAFLDFYYGFPEVISHQPLFFEVVINDISKKKIVKSQKINLQEIKTKQWYHSRISLSNIKEAEYSILFSIEGNSSDTAPLILGEPVIRTKGLKTKSPNIILISLDTLRADHLSCLGYHRVTSPALDRIAKEGVLFTKAFSQSGFTLSSHKSILSGYYPQLFDYNSNTKEADKKKMYGGIPLISTYLKKQGYYNISFTGAAYMSAEFGFYRDFDRYNEIINQMKDIRIQAKAENGNRLVKDIGFKYIYDWLEKNQDSSPFFMLIHTYATHSPYAAPQKYDRFFRQDLQTKLPLTIPIETLRGYNKDKSLNRNTFPEDDLRRIINSYDRGIRWVDDELSNLYSLLEQLNLLDKTIIIILSDHGEEFLEHDKFEHRRMYEECLHVPLIIRAPKFLPRNKIVNQAVELVDIVPTLLDLLKIKTTSVMHGKSFLGLIKNKNSEESSQAIFGSQHNWITVKYRGYKYHLKKKPELYNLSMDPTERNNLLQDEKIQDIKEDLLYKALYYIAENHQGHNILLTNNKRRYDISIKDFTLDENALEEKGRKYVLTTPHFNIFVNTLAAKKIRGPALFTYEGNFEQDYLIEIKSTKENGTSEVEYRNKILLNDSDNKKTNRLSNQIFYHQSCPPDIRIGLNRAVRGKFEALYWKTIFGMKKADLPSKEKLTEETIKQLKSLGYLK